MTVTSVSDWEPAALKVAELNHPGACRFRDIMNLASPTLREMLTSEVIEKAAECIPCFCCLSFLLLVSYMFVVCCLF